VLTDLGLRADLRVGAERDFGALLHHFSSGRNHNRKLRDIAESRGLKINEYGVFDAASGQERAGGATEDEIYQALGLPPIPPELREDTGEIEAAQRGELPDLVTLDDFQGQLHCHSTHSDGSATIREMAEAPSRAATPTLPSPTTARTWASPTA
jgi:DNA polymerase (family 10)